MEMKLIEVALALVTIYLILALLATQLSEYWSGATGSRSRNLQAMVREAFGRQSGLVEKFFEYGPIFSLSKGKSKPSAIAPDLFATSFLAVLNKGQPPRLAWRTPSEFVDALDIDLRLNEILRSQLGGVETSWDGFEARIARWYSDIGDRAEGWYKKRNTLWMFGCSLMLAVAFNVDSAYIFKALFQDDDARVAFANIGQLLAESQSSGDNAVSPGVSTVIEAAVSDYERASRAAAEFDIALGGVRTAIKHDARVAGFGYDFEDLRQRCSRVAAVNAKEWYATNSDAWLLLLPSIQQKLDEARYGTAADASALDQSERVKRLREVLACAPAVAVWVKAAQGDRFTEKARSALKEAGDALERAHKIVLDLVFRASGQRHLLQRYVRDAGNFRQCANEAGNSRADFDQCLEGTQSRPLVLGWPARVDQFCDVTVSNLSDGTAAGPDPGNNGWPDWWGCADFEKREALGIPAMDAGFSIMKLISFLLGILTTAVLVSLGAPFWFGLLSKIANLRTAGRVRGLGEGTLPSENRPQATTAGPPGSDPGGAAEAPAPFSDARNEFERGLRPQDVSRLQKALGLSPSGQLDQVTRQAFSARLQELGEAADQELSPVNYEIIVGRRAPAAMGVSSAASNDGPWQRSHEGQAVTPLVEALNRIFPAPAWPALQESVFNDEVRARVVLYRVRTDSAAVYPEKQAVSLAAKPNGELNRLDSTLRDLILADKTHVFGRQDPSWLDDAIGELGITEDGAEAQSDPRVIQYLESIAVVPIAGDQTPWCGAFVGWVMKRANRLDGLAGQPADLLAATSWKNFGTDSSASPMPGDICVVEKEGHHHVAFWIAQDSSRVWLLGGNQGKTGAGAVTLVAFRLPAHKIVALRRP
ncbi:hypothetical protein D0B54_12145 [Solimonas sp. K1W22B-7]|uniref:hypothetical protein n=1 Tax=Solimonas sp. K1W22B-7 TaxID=2303331 RepID=UPI000E337CF7|nr:hypothetical protein [Solimonas sp. K1W22B-7]AXQ29395.1 hypothetical protein D0B54_12145 [Solimonas sp. K1W22B-7]